MDEYPEYGDEVANIIFCYAYSETPIVKKILERQMDTILQQQPGHPTALITKILGDIGELQSNNIKVEDLHDDVPWMRLAMWE